MCSDTGAMDIRSGTGCLRFSEPPPFSASTALNAGAISSLRTAAAAADRGLWSTVVQFESVRLLGRGAKDWICLEKWRRRPDLNRRWRFCRFDGVVNCVVSCWSLVCPAPRFCLVSGRYWTTFGLRPPVIACPRLPPSPSAHRLGNGVGLSRISRGSNPCLPANSHGCRQSPLGSPDRCHLLDVPSGTVSAMLRGHTQTVTSLSFSADGPRQRRASFTRRDRSQTDPRRTEFEQHLNAT